MLPLLAEKVMVLLVMFVVVVVVVAVVVVSFSGCVHVAVVARKSVQCCCFRR